MDTNENRNGVVRKILPKGSPFDAILDEEMRRIDRMLNDRPLKRLDWRTPSRAGLAFGAHQVPFIAGLKIHAHVSANMLYFPMPFRVRGRLPGDIWWTRRRGVERKLPEYGRAALPE